MQQTIETIEINGTKYVRADAVQSPVPNGAYRGNSTAPDGWEKDGSLYLRRKS